jgi:hypothetical protein
MENQSGNNREYFRVDVMHAYLISSFYDYQVEMPLAVGAVWSRVLLRGWAWAREAQDLNHRARPMQAPCLE